jgi:hypothetical protein
LVAVLDGGNLGKKLVVKVPGKVVAFGDFLLGEESVHCG